MSTQDWVALGCVLLFMLLYGGTLWLVARRSEVPGPKGKRKP